MELLLNILFAFLAFFLVRWVGSMVIPEGRDSDKVVIVIAVIVAIVVYFANLAEQVV